MWKSSLNTLINSEMGMIVIEVSLYLNSSEKIITSSLLKVSYLESLELALRGS